MVVLVMPYNTDSPLKQITLSIEAYCPKCQAGYTYEAIRSLWVSAHGQPKDVSGFVIAPCCEGVLKLAEVKSMWCRAMSAKRVTFGAGSGRPRLLDRCPCGKMSTTRAGKRVHICKKS